MISIGTKYEFCKWLSKAVPGCKPVFLEGGEVLEARRDAILHGYCFTGHLSNKPYLDPYGLDDELLNEEEK